MSGTKIYCAGKKLTGYWKGYPCGAAAIYKHNGKMYCGAHFAAVSRNLKVFDDVKPVCRKDHQ